MPRGTALRTPPEASCSASPEPRRCEGEEQAAGVKHPEAQKRYR